MSKRMRSAMLRMQTFPVNTPGVIAGITTMALLALSGSFNPFHFSNSAITLLRTVGWTAAIVLFVLLLRRVVQGKVHIALPHALLATALLAAPLLLAQPIFSGDVYAYAVGVRVARMGNPYVLPPAAIGNEPILQGVAPEWWQRPSAYGPLWQLVSRGVGALQLSDLAAITLFRTMMLGAVLACVWLIAKKTEPIRALLFGASPFVLVDAVADAHNDTFVGAALLVAVALLHRPVRSAFAFAASVAIKFLPIVSGPALLCAAPREQRKKYFLWICIALCSVLLVTFFPFWVGPQTFTGIQLQGQLFGHPIFFPQFLIFITGYLLQLPIHPEVFARAVGTALFALVTLGVCMWSWRKTLTPVAALALTLGAYVLFATPYVQTWYLLWLLPLLCVLPVRAAVRWTAVASILWVSTLILLPSHFIAS